MAGKGRTNSAANEPHPRHSETRACPKCGAAYVNNAAAWADHRDNQCTAKEMSTVKAKITKTSVTFTDEQQAQIVAAVNEGQKFAHMDTRLFGLSGRASYNAVRNAAIAHFGSLEACEAARKAGAAKNAPEKKPETKATKTAAKATATKSVKPDPKPATKKRTTTRKRTPVAS